MSWLCKLFTIFIILCPLCYGCFNGEPQTQNAVPPPAISFYYWKTTYDPGPESLKRMNELNVNRLYLRFFEVNLNQWHEPVPHATVIFNQMPHIPVAPVIYFDLKVFAQKHLNAEKFAQNLVGRVLEMGEYHKLEFVKELHIDCDWTPSIRENFFEFTSAVKAALPPDWELVVTLRLDQVKNFAVTGVPAGADKAVVMAYNMGNLRQPGAHNSILDPNVSARYLKAGNPYPLPLDVALPLFEWIVVFNIRDEFTGLLRTVPPELFDESFCRPEGSNIYTVLQAFDTGDGWVATPGYRLRLEDSCKDDLFAVAGLLAKAAPRSQNLIFFHLEDKIVKEWPAHELEDIARSCR